MSRVHWAYGCTRMVLLTRHWAFKLPTIWYGWRPFLYGLLANDMECKFDVLKHKRLCPVTFSLPLGLLVVMPRVDVLVGDDLPADLLVDYGTDSVLCAVEKKADSWGWLGGRLVAVDYGGYGGTPTSAQYQNE